MAITGQPRPATPQPAPPDGSRALARTPRPGRAHVLIPVALALSLGLWGLRRQGAMWRDEAVTHEMAHRSLPDLLRTVADYDTVHGLYYALMHGVFALFGDSLVALRLPSVLATAAAAAGVAVLGCRLAGPGAGLATGMIFPMLPDVQRYSQEGRSYALVCAAVVWATVLLVRAMADKRTCPWVGYAALALGACLLHEFAVLALLAHGVVLLASRIPVEVWRAWGAAAGCVAIGLAPLAMVSTGQIQLVAWISAPSPGTYLGIAAVAAIAVACSALAGRRTAALALPLVLVPKAALLMASLAKPLYVERYVLYSSAGLALLRGAALQTIWRRRSSVRLGIIVVMSAATVVLVVPVGQHLRAPASRTDDVSAVASAVQAQAAPGDGLLFIPARRRVWELPAEPAYRKLTDLSLDADPRTSHTLYGSELPPQRIRHRILTAHRIIVIQDPTGQPLDQTPRERIKRTTLRAHFERCSTTEVQGARISVYTRPGTC